MQTALMKTRTGRLTRRKASPWYSIKDKAADRAEVFIFDEIGFFGVSADRFVRDLSAIKSKNIDLRLNTPGGNVFEGMAIFNALKAHPAEITTHIEGLAASIGSVIALAGSTINIAKNAFMMIHQSFTIALGNAEELRREAGILDKIDNAIADIYSEHTGETMATIMGLMEDETWFTAEEAEDIGLADNIIGEATEENQFDLSIFNHAPKLLMQSKKKSNEKFTERDIEQILRDAGVPISQSKATASGRSKRAGLRDADKELKDQLLIHEMKSIIRS